jgi:hypothetical protein
VNLAEAKSGRDQRGGSALLHVQPYQNAKSIKAISNHDSLGEAVSMRLAAGHAFPSQAEPVRSRLFQPIVSDHAEQR